MSVDRTAAAERKGAAVRVRPASSPLLTPLLLATLATLAPLALVPSPAAAERPGKVFFEDKTYDVQAIRACGYALTGGADFNECVRTLKRIPEGVGEAVDESWYREWVATAARVEARARLHAETGHRESARTAYLRASNYWRTAEFFLRAVQNDPRAREASARGRDCFLQAARSSEGAVVPVKIPFGETTLPGYWIRPVGWPWKRPLVIVHTGYDGTGEELYLGMAEAALRRGYHVLIFEGPGQGAVLREQGLAFRPDWEKVVSPVVDFAAGLRGIDPARIALMGISFGGHLAARAAAFEPRLAALVVNGGIQDFHGAVVAPFGDGIEGILDDPGWSKQLDEEVEGMLPKSPGLRWLVRQGKWVFGEETVSGYLRATRPYTMKGLEGLVRCPTLVVDSSEDESMPRQAKPFYDALTCPKEYLLFTREDDAEGHCQLGAMAVSTERILDWLDDCL